MKVYDKSLLIDDNSIYFDENHIINKIKIEKRIASSFKVELNASDMGKDIINRFINDKKLYKCIQEYFNSNCCPMSVSIIKEGKLHNYYLYKKNLLETIEVFIKDSELNLNNECLNNIKELTNSISLKKLKQELNNRTFTLKINNKYISYPCNLIFNFLEIKDNEFYDFFEKDEDYNGLNKSMFLYFVKEFYKQYNEGYLFDNNTKKRIDYINKQNSIEFVKFDKKFIRESSNSIYRNIEINEELEKEILKNIPNNLSQLEQVLYVYIKMCKIFKFDLEGFAARKATKVKEYLKDINYLKNINLNNNNVVCWQFNAIFAHFLDKLNIDFEVRQEGENYGDTHAWLRVNIDDLLISFDSTHNFVWNFDLMNAKVNNTLKGIKLYNKNKNLINSFDNLLNKVYKLIIREEDNQLKKDIQNINYSDLIKNENNLSSDNILKLIVYKAENQNLPEIESIGYLLNLYEQSLNYENKEKIKSEMLVKNINNEIKMCVLFTTYDNKIDEKNREYNYYIYIPNESFERIERETLKKYLDNEIYEIHNKNKDISIPGIDYISYKEIDYKAGRIK